LGPFVNIKLPFIRSVTIEYYRLISTRILTKPVI
jgi:hypothetical protein